MTVAQAPLQLQPHPCHIIISFHWKWASINYLWTVVTDLETELPTCSASSKLPSHPSYLLTLCTTLSMTQHLSISLMSLEHQLFTEIRSKHDVCIPFYDLSPQQWWSKSQIGCYAHACHPYPAIRHLNWQLSNFKTTTAILYYFLIGTRFLSYPCTLL